MPRTWTYDHTPQVQVSVEEVREWLTRPENEDKPTHAWYRACPNIGADMVVRAILDEEAARNEEIARELEHAALLKKDAERERIRAEAAAAMKKEQEERAQELQRREAKLPDRPGCHFRTNTAGFIRELYNYEGDHFDY